jgi:hypothetical protein
MNQMRTYGWRLALIGSGIALVAGGRMHPEADAKDSLREELATMTSDDRWVVGHSLIVLSTVLLALGLWLARRHEAGHAVSGRRSRWRRAVSACTCSRRCSTSARVVDSDALHDGEALRSRSSTSGSSVVLYPLSGWAGRAAALRLGRAWGGVVVRASPRSASSLGSCTSRPSLSPCSFPTPRARLCSRGRRDGVALWSVGTGSGRWERTTPRRRRGASSQSVSREGARVPRRKRAPQLVSARAGAGARRARGPPGRRARRPRGSQAAHAAGAARRGRRASGPGRAADRADLG